jgi:putative phosphoribosyl transferase
MERFRDRAEGGRLLAERLREVIAPEDARARGLVLALPRGGVPVAVEICRALRLPMDVFIVRRLPLPGHAELAMGAIASGGVRVLNEDVVAEFGVTDDVLASVANDEERELQRQERVYRAGRPVPPVRGRTVILVDDGLATGSSMRAAVAALRLDAPARIILAAPVGARDTCEVLGEEVDRVVCLHTPEPFHAVGFWYDRFEPVDDAAIRAALKAAGTGIE